MGLSADVHPPPSPARDARALAQDACADAGLAIREAHDATVCHDIARVLSAVWTKPDQPIIDPALLIAMTHAGNLGFLASRDGAPVGAAVGFCGPPGTPFHSHIVGLLPESTGRGLGRAIKLHQRAWCLERGIAEMTWTFDPLVGRNAYFNIQRLGARPVEYLPEFYGAMNDSINSGQLSDRMLMRWDLTTEPPAPGEAQSALGPVGAHDAVADIDGRPSGYRAPPDTRATVTLAVPRDVEGLRRKDAALAHEWRLQTRAAFAQLFAQGWAVTGFTRSSQYVLHHTIA